MKPEPETLESKHGYLIKLCVSGAVLITREADQVQITLTGDDADAFMESFEDLRSGYSWRGPPLTWEGQLHKMCNPWFEDAEKEAARDA